MCVRSVLMYNKILVPIDGSETADKALQHSINLARAISKNDSKESNIEIIIIHVIAGLSIPLGFEKPMRSLTTGQIISFSAYIKEMHESMTLRVKEMLFERKKKYENKISDIHNGTKLVISTKALVAEYGISIPDAITKFADKEKVDLIVVGNIGLSGISKVKILGSVSRAIVERAGCPVLIVH